MRRENPLLSAPIGSRCPGSWAAGLLVTVAAMLLSLASPAEPQSITRGRLDGTVRDSAGAPFYNARVQVTQTSTGVTWVQRTDATGRFGLPLLPEGNYDVVIEAIGYQPILIEDLPIGPGRLREVSATLETVQLPVAQLDASRYAGLVEDTRVGMSQWFHPFEIFGFAEERRGLSELGRLSTLTNTQLATEGLPGWLSTLNMDGLSYEPSRHPDLPPGPLDTELFALSGFRSAEFLTNPVDVEWSEAAGGYLSGYTRQGTATPQFRFYGDWSGATAVSSDYLTTDGVTANSFRGGAVLTGPIVTDTAHYALGFEAQRLELPLPPAWANDSFDSALLGVADSLGVDLTPYTQTRVLAADQASAYGRFDWHITQNHSVSARGEAAAAQVGGDTSLDPGLAPEFIASLGTKVDAIDLSAGATLASRFSKKFYNELRVGFERTDRDYMTTSPPGTRIIDGGLAFGMDPTLPGEFLKFALRGSETLHFTIANHQFKGGIGALFTSYEQRYTWANSGEFGFGSVADFENLSGQFGQATGAPPFAKFRNWQLAFYIQDVWTAAPGLEVLLGLRYEHERLDSAAVALNQEWLVRTGLANTTFQNKIDKYSPRFGFRWDISRRGEWLVRGSAGIYHNTVPGGVFGELVAQDGSVETRRGVGALGSWPDAPGLAAVPIVGPRLTLLGPEFQAPRTGRTSGGIARLFRDGTGIFLSGTYRYTDFLPRRKDLNLALGPSTSDQYGRPVFGNLVKEGSLLAVEPGTNRRFPNYSLVSAIDADGNSKFWGVTLAVERNSSDWLDFLASYTYSWTQDSWLSANGGGPEVQLNPFPRGVPVGRDWGAGDSDFDAPHQLVVGAQLNFPAAVAGLRLAGFYRFRSGRPFTPGFRDGVDVNGDGSGRNDPAFIDGSLPGMGQLLSSWDCLAEQDRQFVERNSCRGPSVHRLDLRLAVGLFRFQDMPLEIVLDAMNLLDADLGVTDAALYLIDAENPIQTNPDGTITVPLIVNSNFGEPLSHYSTGRAFRLGLRMGL